MLTNFHDQIKFTASIDWNVSTGGTGFARWQNLKFHNFRSTKAIDLKFSLHLIYYKVYCCSHLPGCSSNVTAANISKRNPENWISGARDWAEIHFFNFSSIIFYSIPWWNSVPVFNKIGPAKPSKMLFFPQALQSSLDAAKPTKKIN